jgi:hypothetical protein
MQRILFIAVVVLGINALTGIGTASDRATAPVKVITGIKFVKVLSARASAGQGEVGYALATCPKGSVQVGGGYLTNGTYTDSPPSVLTSAAVGAGWRAALAQPGSGGGDATITAQTICAQVTYATIKTG